MTWVLTKKIPTYLPTYLLPLENTLKSRIVPSGDYPDPRLYKSWLVRQDLFTTQQVLCATTDPADQFLRFYSFQRQTAQQLTQQLSCDRQVEVA